MSMANVILRCTISVPWLGRKYTIACMAGLSTEQDRAPKYITINARLLVCCVLTGAPVVLSRLKSNTVEDACFHGKAIRQH